jgi:hypothetical protein
LNLFLALLLASFGSNVLAEREKEDDDNKIGEAVERIQRCFRFICRSIFRLCRRKKRQKFKMTSTDTNETIYCNQVCAKIALNYFHSMSSLFSHWLEQVIYLIIFRSQQQLILVI